jgi:hypothetical protein
VSYVVQISTRAHPSYAQCKPQFETAAEAEAYAEYLRRAHADRIVEARVRYSKAPTNAQFTDATLVWR